MGGVRKPYTREDLRRRHLICNGRHQPYNPDNVEYARALRKNMTDEEKKLWYGFLRKHRLRFLRQRPIDHYILDFYCAKARLGIEIDGAQHYSDRGKLYDKRRSDILSVFGITIIRFTNYEVRVQFDRVCRRIQTEIDRATE